MRAIDPKAFDRHREHNAVKKKVRLVFVILFLCTLALGAHEVLVMGQNVEEKEIILTKKVDQDTETESVQAPSEIPVEQPKIQTVEPKLKYFSGEEFKNFYNSFAYPNVTRIYAPPVISDDQTADARIRSIAEGRGYQLRSSPASDLGTVDGVYLQQKAQQPWLNLKAAAKNNGLTLSIVSGYRSVDAQRKLFLDRLAATGATNDQVAAGTADAKVNSVLVTSSIPGYSRHHTGYTLDLKCGSQNFELFASSACFTWLSGNNYENAKKYGWIPSYPSGAGLQGPDPEPWEYVWVGTDLLYQ
jgi:D-alanyl-D-alanine carboxypeptidase